jgi:predicted enzyme related to lactoylglutathione lyase
MGRIKVQITILCEFGNFYGEILEVSIEQYRNIVELSKNYYETGFEMGLDNGGFVIIPPDVVKKSVLQINIIKEDVYTYQT